MSIDTSSYYPEVPSPEGEDDDFSLNNRKGGLFGDSSGGDSPVDTGKTQIQEPVSPEEKEKDDRKSTEKDGVSLVSAVISWILVPLMMPVYGLILAFGLSILYVAPIGMRLRLTSIIFGINVVIPMILIFLLKKLNVVDDIGLNCRKDRLLPYIMTIICFGISARFLAGSGVPLWLSLFFAGGVVASLVNMVINLKWKISAHASGIAGIVALLIRIAKDGSPQPELFVWLLIAIGLSGLLGSARVWLGRHTVWQVLAGYAVGFCSVFFMTMVH